MTADPHLLIDDQRRFSGAVGASLSHEINNVLAIVSELNGIIEDLHAFRGSDEPISPEKLENLTGRISKELDRGKDFVKLLNRFAHSVDHPAGPLDLAEVIDQVSRIIARPARLRNVAVATGSLCDNATVTGNRLDLLHLLYRVTEVAMLASVKGATVTILLEREGTRFRVQWTGDLPCDVSDTVSGKHVQAAAMARKTGGALDAALDAGKPVAMTLELNRELSSMILYGE